MNLRRCLDYCTNYVNSKTRYFARKSTLFSPVHPVNLSLQYNNVVRSWHWQCILEKQKDSLHPGAGTIKPEIISSLMTGGSDGGGGHTRLSIMSSVTRIMPVRSGGSVLDDRIIMQRPTSSCRTLSKYIISRSLTMAPLITMISSPLMIPERKRYQRAWRHARAFVRSENATFPVKFRAARHC